MSRNRVQHQKGLSDDGFEQRYPDLYQILMIGICMNGSRSSCRLAYANGLMGTDQRDLVLGGVGDLP